MTSKRQPLDFTPLPLDPETALRIEEEAAFAETARRTVAEPTIKGPARHAYLWALAVPLFWAAGLLAFNHGFERPLGILQLPTVQAAVLIALAITPFGVALFAAYIARQGARLGAEAERTRRLAEQIASPTLLASALGERAVIDIAAQIAAAEATARAAREQLMALRAAMAADTRELVAATAQAAQTAERLHANLGAERTGMEALAVQLGERADALEALRQRNVTTIAQASDLAHAQLVEAEAALAARATALETAGASVLDASRAAGDDLSRQTLRLETATAAITQQAAQVEAGLNEQRIALAAAADNLWSEHDRRAEQAEALAGRLDEALLAVRSGTSDMREQAAVGAEGLRELLTAAATHLARLNAAVVDRREALEAETTAALDRIAAAAESKRAGLEGRAAGVNALVAGLGADMERATRRFGDVADARLVALQAAVADADTTVIEALDARLVGARKLLESEAVALADRMSALALQADATADQVGEIADARLRALRAAADETNEAVVEMLDGRLIAARAALEREEAALGARLTEVAVRAEAAAARVGDAGDLRLASLLEQVDRTDDRIAEALDQRLAAARLALEREATSLSARIADLADQSDAAAIRLSATADERLTALKTVIVEGGDTAVALLDHRLAAGRAALEREAATVGERISALAADSEAAAERFATAAEARLATLQSATEGGDAAFAEILESRVAAMRATLEREAAALGEAVSLLSTQSEAVADRFTTAANERLAALEAADVEADAQVAALLDQRLATLREILDRQSAEIQAAVVQSADRVDGVTARFGELSAERLAGLQTAGDAADQVAAAALEQRIGAARAALQVEADGLRETFAGLAARSEEAAERLTAATASQLQALRTAAEQSDATVQAAGEQRLAAVRTALDQLAEASFATAQQADAHFESRMTTARKLVERSGALVDEAGDRAISRVEAGVEGVRSAFAEVQAGFDAIADRLVGLPGDARAASQGLAGNLDELVAAARRAAEETQAIDAAFQDRIRRNYEMLSQAVRLMGEVTAAGPQPAPAPASPSPASRPSAPAVEVVPEAFFAPPAAAGSPDARPRLRLTTAADDDLEPASDAEFHDLFVQAGGQPEASEAASEDGWTWRGLLGSIDARKEPGPRKPNGA